MPRYPHLLLENTSTTERYTATRAFPREPGNPDRVRETHAAHVIAAFEAAKTQRETFPVQVGNGFYESPGIILSFESDPHFPLAFESLDLSNMKIQLLSVITDEQNRTVATIRVPDDKISKLLAKLEAYRCHSW